MIVWPGVSVPTEVGTIKVEFLSDQYVLRYEPWKGDIVTIDWLERDDIEALGKACSMLVASVDQMGA